MVTEQKIFFSRVSYQGGDADNTGDTMFTQEKHMAMVRPYLAWRFSLTGVSLQPQRPKLSDPASGTRGLQPQRDGRVRCSAWLGVAGIVI
jgi:hypothetical protein